MPLRNNYDNVYDYKEYVQLQIKNEFKPDTYPCVTPMWDNSARRKVNYFILHNSSPEVYKEWIKTIKNSYPWDKMKDSFFFINAWNEWAEGNHLEPCHKWGQSYLKATKEAFVDINT